MYLKPTSRDLHDCADYLDDLTEEEASSVAQSFWVERGDVNFPEDSVLDEIV